MLAGDKQRVLTPELALPVMRVVGLNASVPKRTLVPEVFFPFQQGNSEISEGTWLSCTHRLTHTWFAF